MPLYGAAGRLVSIVSDQQSPESVRSSEKSSARGRYDVTIKRELFPCAPNCT